MVVVVTGASGHIGANIVRELLAQGYQVRALVHSSKTALENLDVETVEGDITDYESLLRAFRWADYVIHTAGYVSINDDEWDTLLEMNVNGVKNVISACRKCEVKRMIHFSSIEAVERNAFSKPIDESFPLDMRDEASPYARSKVMGEQLVREAIAEGFDAVIVNPAGVIGPFDFKVGKATQAVINICKGQLPILVCGETNWVDARDVAKAVVVALTLAPRGERYMLSGHKVDLKTLVKIIEAEMLISKIRVYLPIWLLDLFIPAASHYFHLLHKEPLITHISLEALKGNWDISYEKAMRDLSFVPRPFKHTISDMITWMKDIDLI
jgi:dihydroflavonol-4-reductase